MEELDKLMTRKEVAAYLQVCPQTIQVWHHRGQDAPPFIKIGRSVRYKKSEVDAWVQRKASSKITHKFRIEWQAADDAGRPYGPIHGLPLGG